MLLNCASTSRIWAVLELIVSMQMLMDVTPGEAVSNAAVTASAERPLNGPRLRCSWPAKRSPRSWPVEEKQPMDLNRRHKRRQSASWNPGRSRTASKTERSKRSISDVLRIRVSMAWSLSDSGPRLGRAETAI